MVYEEDMQEGQMVWHKTLKECLKLTNIPGRTHICWAVRKDKTGNWAHWTEEFVVHYSDLEVV